MRILIVIGDYFNSSNGMSISTQRFVKEFKEAGHEVRVLASNAGGISDYSVPVLKVPGWIQEVIEKQGYHFAKPVKDIINEAVDWADIVHVEDPFLLCVETAKIAKKNGKPVTGTFHLYPENITSAFGARDSRFLNKLILDLFRVGTYKHCDAIQCPTDKVKQHLVENGYKSNLYTISNGIAESFLDNPHVGNDNPGYTILSIGRYAPEKDQKTLLEAFKLSKHEKDIHLILAGQGPLYKKYEKLGGELTNKPVMKLFTQEELKKVIASSDILVHCANVEIEGMSCMEGFAGGCVPIIADSALSSTAAYALDERNRFDAGDANALADKIDYWIEHPDELEKSRNNYVSYGSELSIKRTTQEVLKMMKECC